MSWHLLALVLLMVLSTSVSADDSVIPSCHGLSGVCSGPQPLSSDGRFEHIRAYVNLANETGDGRRLVSSEKYHYLENFFRGVGLVSWENDAKSKQDGFKRFGGTFFFAGNCHTIITAEHVIFHSPGHFRHSNIYLHPHGDPARAIKVNLPKAKSEGNLYYIHGKNFDANQGVAYDVIGIHLHHGVPDCGAYPIRPMADDLERKLMQEHRLALVGFDAGTYSTQHVPEMVFNPRCRALTGNQVNLPRLSADGYQPQNVLFNDCDQMPGRSGAPYFVVDKSQLYVVGIVSGQTGGHGPDSTKTTEYIQVPQAYKQYLGNVVPNTWRYIYNDPNVGVRLRSHYFEWHPNTRVSDLSNAQYACIRANEIQQTPAFWVIQDTIRQYHQTQSLLAMRTACKMIGIVP